MGLGIAQADAETPAPTLTCPDEFRLITQYSYDTDSAASDADSAAEVVQELSDDPAVTDELEEGYDVAVSTASDTTVAVVSPTGDEDQVLAIVTMENTAGGVRPVHLESCR